MSITPLQSRAARAFLDWTQGQLAKNADVAKRTVITFEGGSAITATIRTALRITFERHGIEFLGQTGLNFDPARSGPQPTDWEKIRPELIDIVRKLVAETMAARGDAPPPEAKALAVELSSKVMSVIPQELMNDRLRLAAYLEKKPQPDPPPVKPIVKVNRPE